jgi:phospholipid/cholesterol/gamma-HCH transport system permease protein
LIEDRSLSPSIQLIQKGNEIDLVLDGAWVTQKLAIPERKMNRFSLKGRPHVQLRFSPSFFADTAGLWLISRFLKKLGPDATSLVLPDSPYHAQLQEYLETKIAEEKPIISQPYQDFLAKVGQRSIELWSIFLALMGFLGEVVVTQWRSLHQSKAVRWISVQHHIEIAGFRALPIIGLISFLIGAVLAYQGINQLSRFGAQVYTVDFLAIGTLREIAVLLTSIVVAGRTGSAFTAEIGTMNLNQEIDAIRILGLNPISVLVIPRMIALLIVLPLLVFFSMIMGMVGGIVVMRLIMDLSPLLLWEQFHRAVTLSTFWVGMSKAPLFAIIISLVGCFRGFQVHGSAESVGKMTTQSVVESIFLVIICDAFMSILFSSLNI